MRLIDADLLLQKRFENGMIDGNEVLVPYNDVVNAIRQAPTVDAVEVRHGAWKTRPQEFYLGDTEWFCSNCKEEFCTGELTVDEFLEMMRYCPHCGAKMDGKENSQ